MKTLENKTVIITGGSRGIGFAIAQSFAQNGADLLIVARNQENLDRSAAELAEHDVRVETLSCDLSVVDSLGDVANSMLDIYPDIHVLVNNAGIAEFAPFPETSTEVLDAQINLNVRAPYVLTQRLLPSITKNKGNIINISSFHASRAWPGIPDTGFALSKGAINAFTKALAYELGFSGVRVNAIAPGNVLTEKVRAFVENASATDEGKARMQQLIATSYPLGRLGDPEELGGIAVYLASDQASWVTGSIVSIDGGLTTN